MTNCAWQLLCMCSHYGLFLQLPTSKLTNKVFFGRVLLSRCQFVVSNVFLSFCEIMPSFKITGIFALRVLSATTRVLQEI